MSNKHRFSLASQESRRELPSKIIIGQEQTETIAHVVLKLLGYVLFYSPRLQVEPSLHDPNIPFTPDLVELDYHLRPKLWVECGECSVAKLHKLATKAPEADLWILKRSHDAVDDLIRQMAKGELRQDRYNLLGFDQDTFEELASLVGGRNEFTWVRGGVEAEELQFDFNGLWFEMPLLRKRF
ncbi:MAG TPA: YaeQ family protein [Methylomirabilota bacterium]|nr:YaeQ family protein [Methylomirabilota bacterium]